jgi:hypothetical protein
MKPMLVLVFTLVAASPARAEPVNWFASGELTFVDDVLGPLYLPGLTVGTPWTMQINFDPAGGPSGLCGQYQVDSTTFTLGGFSYRTPGYGGGGGLIWTSAVLPAFDCSPEHAGAIVFGACCWFTQLFQEPPAWDLNGTLGLMLAGYTDAIRRDGTVPSVPHLSGETSGLNLYDPYFNLIFRDDTFAPTALGQPTPVPEPGTFAMLGIGLACIARRRLRQIG